MIELTPSVANVVEFQLPENIRAQENELFVKFITYYYEWLVQNGQPTEFIQNILSYRDIDLTSDDFRQHVTSSIVSLIPSTSKSDPIILTKHIVEFLRSKGTFESFQFIMNAVYGEEVEMEWNADRVFRPSANDYIRTATMAVESDAPWTKMEGSTLIQHYPHPASATIESFTSTTVNGKHINWLTLDDKSVIGDFIHSTGKVKALRNDVDRNWQYEEDYYTPYLFSNNILKFRATTELQRPYENLVVKQIGSDFRAIVDSFVSRLQNTNSVTVTLLLKNATGTFNGGDIYIFASQIEDEIYLKTDFEYGTVSPAVTGVNISDGGSLYNVGERISLLGGSGEYATAYISETTTGSITEVNILKKGYGYSIGDELKVLTVDSGGTAFAAEVSVIDGINGDITTTSELNGISIVDGGYGFKVNDELEVIGGTLVAGTPPARIIVDAVDSTWALLGANVTSGGYDYPSYTKLALIDLATTTKIAGFGATPTIVNGSITTVSITSTPSITTNNLAIVANGYGAELDALIGAGAITGLQILNGGVNYIDPVIEIIGDGNGAFVLVSMTSGIIDDYTVVKGGAGYTHATIIVKERYGSGAIITPLFRDQDNSSGTISTVSIIEAGNYIELPDCHVVTLRHIKPVITNYTLLENDDRLITESGSTLLLDFIEPLASSDIVTNLNFKLLNVDVDNGGQFYHATTLSISGKGTGAILYPEQVGGVITNVYVINGGQDYYDGTTVTIPGGSVSCSLVPVIVGGVITSITIADGGSGYTPPELLGVTIDSGVDAVVDTTISGTGKIINYTKINGGSGYNSQSELTPINVSATGGTGAKFLPSISNDGKIIKVSILDGGEGYQTSDTISVTGGGGANASLIPVVFGGRIVDVTVENGGQNYSYGTYAIVIGDGLNAAVTPIVETGITNVRVAGSGSNYSTNTTVVIIDDTGTGAEIRPTIVGGKIIDLEILKKGSGYTNPALSLINIGDGDGAVIYADAERFIDYLEITNAGVGYTYADILVVGDGLDADFSITVDKLGTIDTASVTTAGTGYTSTPIITIIDTSAYGAISGVKITNVGGGYRKLPVILMDTKYDEFGAPIASGAKFTCFGKNVGKIKRVTPHNAGADYYDSPYVVFDLTAILGENAAFKIGELVKIKSGIYKDVISTASTLLENDDVLTAENGDTISLDLDDTAYDIGVSATVGSFDFDRNIIRLNGLSDNFYLIDNKDTNIITEDGLLVVDQMSGTFDAGDVIVGDKSRATATIHRVERATGTSIIGGNSWSEFKFINEVGLLNRAASVIADNNRYQDRAYVVKTGRALADYAALLKSTVHPAGYALFGDVKTQTFLESNILNEIGYQQLETLLAIFAIVLDGFESEWSYMDELFGEFTKFNFTIPISEIKDYLIPQTSEYSISNVNQYVAPPLNVRDMSTWSAVNGLQIVNNSGVSPDGSNSMTRITDVETLRTSSIQKTISTTIGNSYTVEVFIKAQVNPLTYPEVSLGSTYVRLNTQTGAYYTNSSGLIDVKPLGDYWWIRISHVATSTTTIATLTPSRGFIANLTLTSNAATGTVQIYGAYVRDITSLSPYNLILRGKNSQYIPTQFRYLATEADIILAAYP